MLYKLIKRMIDRGNTTGLSEKLTVFYNAGKLTKAEYEKLMDLLNTN